MNQVILTASFLVPLILSVVILYNSQNDRPKRIMGWSMVNTAAVFIANYFYFLGEFHVYQYFHSLHVALVLFIYPSIYIYVLYLTQQVRNRRMLFIHFIPGLFFLLLYFIFFDLKFTADERIEYLSTYRSNSLLSTDKYVLVNVIRMVNVLAIAGSVIYYSLSIIRASRRFNRKLLAELSNPEKYRIGWLNKSNIALIAVAIVSVLFYVVDPFSQENNEFLIFSMFLMSIFIWLMGIWGNAQNYIELPANDDLPVNGKDGELSISPNESNELYFKLNELMLQQHLYRRSDLKLDELARQIGTNRSYLSKAINQHSGVNFNQFVNQYRINEVQKSVQNGTDINLDILATEAGFGSISSFRRAFLTDTGMTPEKWLSKKNSNK
ncbi:MAG: helix-turn-helix domain-containing protein [Prolixibacteraceae bacterium]